MGYRQTYGDGGLGSISGVVSSLPAGYTLGEKRVENNIVYRCCYNASNSYAYPGHVVSAVPIMAANASSSGYSMTVTTTSGTGCKNAAAVVHHATAATGTYFWGVTRGRLTSGLVCNAAASASTGDVVAIDTTAGVTKVALATSTAGNEPVAMIFASLTTGSTSPTRTGDALVIIE